VVGVGQHAANGKQHILTSGLCHMFVQSRQAKHCRQAHQSANHSDGDEAAVPAGIVGQQQSARHAHDGGVNCLLLASSNQLVSGGKDGHITRWKGQERVKSIPAHRGVIYGILEVGESLISCSRDKSIKVWEMETWKPFRFSRT
jgi:WD40 repeat protein